MSSNEPLFLGIDFGTSGARAAIINHAGDQLDFQSVALAESVHRDAEIEQDPLDWWQALVHLTADKLEPKLKPQIRTIAIDGTSASLLLANASGHPLSPCLMYNDHRAIDESSLIDQTLPAELNAARGATSALAKLLYLNKKFPKASHALHQADWLCNRLMGQFGHSDDNNCLKMGYDSVAKQWPGSLSKLIDDMSLLPRVHKPGTVIANIDTKVAEQLALSADTQIVAGTTDSIAATYAAGAREIGDAVSSLGSTLVVKVVSGSPISSPEYGVYSHPYGNYWLVGGASNTGGSVLLQHFSVEQLESLSLKINPNDDSGLNYYPLPARGERFPIADPNKASILTPRPEDDAVFLQAMFEGIANIEVMAYQIIAELGTSSIKRLISVGGGSRNTIWKAMRERKLGLKFDNATSNEAAYGSALIARDGYSKLRKEN